jgi:hypothetical protein
VADADTLTYASQSPVTDPGEFAARLDDVPGDVASLQRATCRLVFHYRGDGPFAENNIAADRIGEIDTRYADRMLRRLFELREGPLTDERPPHERLVGCCRDFTVLFLAAARHKGVPARARVGFARYFAAGWNVDHEIAEVWDAGEQRWRLVDPELREGHIDPTDGEPVNPLDIEPTRFIVAPRAWLDCRAGRADPERFVVAPDLDIPATRSWPFLVHNLLQDLAALNKREMVLWDYWRLAEKERLSGAELNELDRAAESMMRDGVTLAELRELFNRDGFAVPAVVTSYSAAASAPLRVSV